MIDGGILWANWSGVSEVGAASCSAIMNSLRP
jgi:hypothetical protein